MESVDVTVPAADAPAVPLPTLPVDGCCVRLSERDAEQVVRDAEKPPAPVPAAVEAAKWFLQRQQHG